MKRLIYFLLFLVSMLPVGGIFAQDGKPLSREERRALEEKIDSIRFLDAVQAIKDKEFTLEADRVMFKRGRTVFVTSNTNFVKVSGDNAVVQVAFNVPVDTPNGIGGITVEGSISSYKFTETKKGNISLSMNVMGRGISAQLNISMMKGSNRATVEISPNFNSNKTTLSGVILPNECSNVFKGTSL